MIKKIIKRDGKIVNFDKRKITFAILQAAIAAGGKDRQTAERITEDVIKQLCKREFKGTYPTVEEVQDLVEKCLVERGHARTAKAYILYRYEHALKRAGKQSLTYSSENIPYKKLWQALSWSQDNGCVSLSQLFNFTENNEVEKLVRLSEDFYKSEINTAASELEKRLPQVKFVIIAGPSASGKTTTTKKIGEILKEKGISIIPFSVDNYFFDLSEHPKDTLGDYDFETPQALDLELINKHLKELLEGKKIRIPYYDFKKGRREGYSKELKLKKGQLLLIDSLHGMFGRMTEGIPQETKFNLYIETLAQVKDKNNRFIRWSDIRLMRRIVRDTQFRNYNPKATIVHWRYVRRSEVRYIVAKLRNAHVIVNSYLPYELPILKNRLKDFFKGFLTELKDDIEYEDAYTRALRVNELFNQIPLWEDDSAVPKDSLLREFIGNSKYSY